jgi:CRISPR system Cascade subunit CasB
MSEIKQYPLIDYLEAHAEDRAMLAALRRGLGQPPGAAPDMFPFVVPFVQKWNEDELYLVASLFGLHPLSTTTGNMGTHIKDFSRAKNFAKVEDDDASTRRFVQLLRYSREAIDTPLRQQINLLKSQSVPVNWHQLLYDMQYWGHEDYFVQRKWASAFWS